MPGEQGEVGEVGGGLATAARPDRASAPTAPPQAPARRRPPRRPALTARAVVTGLCAAAVLAQLVGLLLWSAHVLDRASLTWDFAIYYQPWYLIAHGHLLPRNTLQGGYAFIRNDGEFIVYLLAPLYWLLPDHQLGYLWLQDLAIAGGSATCLAIVTERLPWRTGDPPTRQATAGLARLLVVFLVVADPFVYWTASFDIHMEVFGALFALLALRAGLNGSRSVVVFAVLTGLCGTASLLYLVGLGVALTLVWCWRRRLSRRPAPSDLLAAGWPLALSLLGVVWLSLLGAFHATLGSPSYDYVYLAGTGPHSLPTFGQVLLGVLRHPATAWRVLASHGWNLWANTSAPGFLGLFSPLAFVVVPPLLANNLVRSQAFSYPSFQNFVCYTTIALGSVAVVVTLLRRRRLWPLGLALCGAITWNAVGWHDAFIATSSYWVQLSPADAALIKSVARQVAPEDEVVASNEFLGLFAGREQEQGFLGPSVIPLRARTVWFVLSWSRGIELSNPTETDEAVNQIAHLPGAQAVHFDDDGIFVYRWHPPAGWTTLRLAQPGAPYPVWMFPGPGTSAVTTGPPAGWSLVSEANSTYLIVADYWQLPPGRYEALVRVQSRRAVTPEVWSDDAPVHLLAGRAVRARRAQTVALRFVVGGPDKRAQIVVTGAPIGSGPYRYLPVSSGPLNHTVEVRVWVPKMAHARAWWCTVKPLPG